MISLVSLMALSMSEMVRADSCWRDYAALAGQKTAAAGRAVGNYFRTYWGEVKESPYYSRLLLAPRGEAKWDTAKDKVLHSLLIVGDPISAVGKPLLRDKRLSNPAVIAYWTAAGIKITSKTGQKNVYFLEEQEEHDVGGAYLLQLTRLGLVDAAGSGSAIEKHHAMLNRWLAAQKDGHKAHPRFRDFRAQGLLKNEAEEKILDDLAASVFTRLDARLSPAEKKESRMSQLFREFDQAVAKDPVLGKKTPEERLLLRLIYLPEIKVKNSAGDKISDLAAYRKIQKGEELSEEERKLAILAGQAGEPWAHARKRALAGLPEHKRYLEEQVNVLLEPRELRSFGQSMILRTDLDYWRLLQSDPKFAYIADPWRKGELGDAAAIAAMVNKIDGLRELEAIEKSGGFTPKVACELLGYTREAPNHSFAKVRLVMNQVEQSMGLTPAAFNECRYRVTEAYWNFFQGERALSDASQHAAFVTGELQKIHKLVNESCPAMRGAGAERFACPQSNAR